ncbi:MAG: hypothetical protein Q9164_002441 [Protoblastenia rupestris]
MLHTLLLKRELPTLKAQESSNGHIRARRHHSNLDGWEPDDDPIDEHLKHSSSCGWAVAGFTERAIEKGDDKVEDPLSQSMIDARQMTFGTIWPHENKRGWLCRIQKMAEAGWHYAPTMESDDFVRCSEEHQRRSPDCMIFSSVIAVKPKGSSGKKGRASKASRLSTQSAFSVASEGASIANTEVKEDESMVSTTVTAMSGKGRGGRKGTKAKKPANSGKTTRPKVEEPALASSYIEPEDDDFSVKIDQSPEPIPRGKKRSSNHMTLAEDTDTSVIEADNPEPPSKRRATRTRRSVAISRQTTSAEEPKADGDLPMADVEEEIDSSAPTTKKGIKGRKKKASSVKRRTSTMSTASKASLRAGVPDDNAIDAALELDLERPLTDKEGDVEPVATEQPKGRRLTRTKPGSKNKTASVAPTRKGTRASTMVADEPVRPDQDHNEPTMFQTQVIDEPSREPSNMDHERAGAPILPEKGAKGSTARKPSGKPKARVVEEDDVQMHIPLEEVTHTQGTNQITRNQIRDQEISQQSPIRITKASTIITTQDEIPVEPDLESSMLDLPTVVDESGHETDASIATKGGGKRPRRKKPVAVKKGKKSKGIPPTSQNIEGITQPPEDQVAVDIKAGPVDEAQEKDQAAVDTETMDAEEKAASSHEEIAKPKKQSRAAKTASKPPKGKKRTTKSKSVPKEPTPVPSPANQPAPPQAPPAQLTPVASPQSSDIENHPPSSRPSQLRPPLATQSLSKSETARIPLAVITPSRSPSKNTFSKLQSSIPWTAVDLEQIFQGTPKAGKENDPFALGPDAAKGVLTSPENKMTVEQWIQFNAQRGEEKLRVECERLVGTFEGEGMRALKTLEGIACVSSK